MDRRDLLIGGMALAAGSAASAHDKHKLGNGSQHHAIAPPGSRQTIFQEADGEHLVRRAGPMGGLPFTIKLDGQVGGSRDMFVFTEALSPGQTIPWHRHDGCEEVMLVEEGGMTITVGMERKEAGPRAMAFMPQAVWHSATNVSDHTVHITSVYSGHDFAYYLRAISVEPGQPIIPINPEDLPRLRALGHATYWDSKLGPFPPGVAHP